MPVSFAVLAAAVLGFVAPSVWRHPNLKKSCPLILLIHFLFVGQVSKWSLAFLHLYCTA
jgi:hypothetical protein